MSYITFHDISYAQGRYNMAADPSPIVEIKMTGFYYGSKTGYCDVQATTNYANAKQFKKIPLLYHFAGGADPIEEADYFVTNGAMPFADGDIYELDYELTAEMNPPADPDTWCRTYADRVKTRTGKYPILYTNTSIFLAHNKFPKTMQVCSLIIADYRYTPEQDVPCGYPYIAHQFTDTPIDTNALFIPLDVFKKYAYETNQAVSKPAIPPTVPTPTTQPQTTSTSSTTSTSTSTTTLPIVPIINDPLPPTIAQPLPAASPAHWYDRILRFLRWLSS